MTAALPPAASASGASGPASNGQPAPSATSPREYPQGHFAHLAPRELEALDGFKTILEEKGLYKRGPPASHDDPTLIRFLRARKWVPQEALKQFQHTEQWRVANDIDTLYKTFQIDAYEQSRRLHPQWTGRSDRRGFPIYVFEVKSLDSKSIAEYERIGASSTFSEAKTDGKTPSGQHRILALYESLTRFTLPFCTQLTHDRIHPETAITMTTNIVDISGVGLKQFWNLKSHMQAASQLATAHYPETLDRIFIIGAPFFFSTVLEWVKRWFDPVTFSKIFVLSPQEVKSTLEKYMEPCNIPKKYGGELDFSYGQLPVSDPRWENLVQWEDGFSQFPTGPLLWEALEDGKRLACNAYGTESGKPRRQCICTIPISWPLASTEVNGDLPKSRTETTSIDTNAAPDSAPSEPIAAGAVDDALRHDKVQANGAGTSAVASAS